MTGIYILWHSWGANPSCTRMEKAEGPGHHGASMGGAWDHQRTTTDVSFTTSLKPETRTYRISGSTELFPQYYCQMPNLTPDQHFQALTEELANETASVSNTPNGQCLIKILRRKIKQIMEPATEAGIMFGK